MVMSSFLFPSLYDTIENRVLLFLSELVYDYPSWLVYVISARAAKVGENQIKKNK